MGFKPLKNPKSYLLIISILLMLMIGFPAYSESKTQQTIVKWLSEKGINPYIIPAIISMLPISELRGGIPVGLFMFRLNPAYLYTICVIANMLPIFPLLFFLNGIMKFLRERTKLTALIERLEIRAKKNKKLIERYKELGLLLFVAIPLPVTGAWTGSLLSTVFKLNIYKSLIYIGLGVTVAGGIVMGISILGKSFLIGAVILILIIIIIYSTLGIIKLKKNN